MFHMEDVHWYSERLPQQMHAVKYRSGQTKHANRTASHWHPLLVPVHGCSVKLGSGAFWGQVDAMSRVYA